MRKIFFILSSFLALLLLFGCISPGEPSANESQKPQGIGDADISVNQPANESDILPEVEPIEADVTRLNDLEAMAEVSQQVNEIDYITDAEKVEQG